MNRRSPTVVKTHAPRGEARLLMTPAAARAIRTAAARETAPPLHAASHPRTAPPSEHHHALFEQAREQAVRAGHAEGLRQGLAEARAQGEQQARQAGQALQAAQQSCEQHKTRLQTLLQALPQALAEAREHCLLGLEETMAALVQQAVCVLLGDKLAAAGAPAAVRQALRTWAQQDRENTAVTVFVHPQDHEALAADPELQAWLQDRGSAAIAWRADARVALGGCLIRSAAGTVDARLETQLAALSQLLRQADHHPPQPAPDGTPPHDHIPA
ncbi:hypothetical protein GT347_14975 [Xylophilus rhododendri]|uniref:Flagellar assembly protein FliH n=1 Tax=Xylophilus rhododendri TaxID=2697032 RepID=A0A857J8R3_9BURK|nr:FliH/SctL family protein [Xylophilus rhododendri]QHI99165.1 hypothetical protein GT347_14975 [Xylophilus rhododendri]